jgi:hypothetical protein
MTRYRGWMSLDMSQFARPKSHLASSTTNESKMQALLQRIPNV